VFETSPNKVGLILRISLASGRHLSDESSGKEEAP
jgi:hypothetical protein